MKDGADAECATNGHDGFHRGMKRRSVEEGETMFSECRCALGGRERNGDVKGFEDVGGAALRGDGAVAVLGDGGSSGCCDEGGGGGDVEGAAGVCAGAAGVDEEG